MKGLAIHRSASRWKLRKRVRLPPDNSQIAGNKKPAQRPAFYLGDLVEAAGRCVSVYTQLIVAQQRV
jgi:hypothetical protein